MLRSSGGEKSHELLDGLGREFLEQGSPIVGRHLIQDGGGGLLAHGAQQALLFLGRKIFEDIRRLGLG